MPKLFVAVDLPAGATMELARIQPKPLVGIRLAATDQMHLTLHFIGEAEVDRMAAALSAVTASVFALTISGVGQFQSAKGEITLWAGIQECAELLHLHAAVAASLAGTGFRTETRRYNPHITLARCGTEVPRGVVDEFLGRHNEFLFPDVWADGFSLYSSVMDRDVPVYKRERLFGL